MSGTEVSFWAVRANPELLAEQFMRRKLEHECLKDYGENPCSWVRALFARETGCMLCDECMLMTTCAPKLLPSFPPFSSSHQNLRSNRLKSIMHQTKTSVAEIEEEDEVVRKGRVQSVSALAEATRTHPRRLQFLL